MSDSVSDEETAFVSMAAEALSVSRCRRRKPWERDGGTKGLAWNVSNDAGPLGRTKSTIPRISNWIAMLGNKGDAAAFKDVVGADVGAGGGGGG